MTAALAGAFALLAAGAVAALPAAASETHSPAHVVSQMTGPGSLSDTDTRWAVTGTDLGIMWDNGNGEILTALGDTFGDWSGPGGGGGDWRSNVLLRSSDRDLSDGMTFDSAVEDTPGHAAELIPSKKVDGEEMTTIPTAGIEVDGVQYMAFMSVRHWGPPGEWDTNFSRIAYSTDNGETWNSTDGPEWTNDADGQHPFQMVAFEKHDGYVYMFGTPNGRLGAVHVARVPEADILDKDAYAYWDGGTWVVGDDTAAEPVVPPAAAELSVRYDEHTGSWLMMYLDGNLDIVLRTADSPEGLWSDSQVVASFADYPGLYGGFIHPWSEGDDLYFAMSQWDPYNVFLMKVEIDEEGVVRNPNRIQDPSFERAADGSMPAPWKCSGNCGIDTNHSWAYAGSKQAWMRHNSGWIDIYQDVAVEPGTTYTFSGFVVTGGAPASGSLGVREGGAGGQTLAEAEFEQVGRYTRYSVTFHSGDRTSVQAFVGTHLDGDRWVQIDDLVLVEAEEQLPSWSLTKTADPAAGGDVVREDVITYAVTAATESEQSLPATVTEDLAGVLDDADLVPGSVTTSHGEVVLDGGTITWTVAPTAETPATLAYQVRVRRDAARTDSVLTSTTSGAAADAVLASCEGCTTTHTAVAYDPRPPRPDFPDRPGRPENLGGPDRPGRP